MHAGWYLPCLIDQAAVTSCIFLHVCVWLHVSIEVWLKARELGKEELAASEETRTHFASSSLLT